MGYRKLPGEHICLACGCLMSADEPQDKIIQTGRNKGVPRYRHASDRQCQQALSRAQPNVARIGKYRQ